MARRRILWQGIDQGVIDAAVNDAGRRCEACFRRSAAHAVGQHPLVCGLDRAGAAVVIALHDLDVGGTMITLEPSHPDVGNLCCPCWVRCCLSCFPRRDRDIRIFALVISLLTFVLSLHLPVYFKRPPSPEHFSIESTKRWITSPNIHYHMGIDGISLWLMVLTTFLTPLCVLISWTSIHDRVKEFFILLLILETALIGVFTSLDLFLFYFFWEATLIPMALLIGMFGHERKVYAAVKFFMYTMIASVFMLAAILWLYAHTGSFDFVTIRDQIASGAVPKFPAAAQWLFLRILSGVCGEGSAVSLPHVVAGRARGSANRGFCAAGGRAAEDGHVRIAALQRWIVPRTSAAERVVDHDSRGNWNHLRRARGHGAAQYEKADRLFFSQPSWVRGAGHLQFHATGSGRGDVCDAGAWGLDWGSIHACGRPA